MNTKFSSKTHEIQATQQYKEVRAECADLLHRISQGLDKHGGDNLSWPALGSVKHTKEILIEALAAIGGLTQEEMEKYHI